MSPRGVEGQGVHPRVSGEKKHVWVWGAGTCQYATARMAKETNEKNSQIPIQQNTMGAIPRNSVWGLGSPEGPHFPSEDRDLPYWASCVVRLAIPRQNWAKLGKSQGSQSEFSPFSSRMRAGQNFPLCVWFPRSMQGMWRELKGVHGYPTEAQTDACHTHCFRATGMGAHYHSHAVYPYYPV